jgi:hypothetical protein
MTIIILKTAIEIEKNNRNNQLRKQKSSQKNKNLTQEAFSPREKQTTRFDDRKI